MTMMMTRCRRRLQFLKTFLKFSQFLCVVLFQYDLKNVTVFEEQLSVLVLNSGNTRVFLALCRAYCCGVQQSASSQRVAFAKLLHALNLSVRGHMLLNSARWLRCHERNSLPSGWRQDGGLIAVKRTDVR